MQPNKPSQYTGIVPSVVPVNLVNNHLEFIISYQDNYRIQQVNSAVVYLLGFQINEFLQLDFSSHFPSEEFDLILNALEQVRSQGITLRLEHQLRQKSDNFIWVESYFILGTDKDHVVWRATDITERCANEIMIKYNERLFKGAFDSTLLGMAILSDDGYFVEVNSALLNLLGYEESEVFELSDEDLTHPDDILLQRQLIAEQNKNNTPFFILQKRYRHKNGEYVWVLANFSRLIGEKILASGYIVQMQDLGIIREAIQQIEILEQEKLSIESKKVAELETLKERFIERISHEFRTPLAVIQTTGELLEQYSTKISESRRLTSWERIKQEIRHIVKMLEDSLLMLRRGNLFVTHKMQDLDLQSLVTTQVAWNQDTLGQNYQFILQINDEIPIISGDTALMWVAVDNLFKNAIKYSEKSYRITTTLSLTDKFIELRVSNENQTISEEDIPFIFETFYRGANIKEQRGLGLGLPIVRQIMRLHGGDVFLEIVPNTSTTFCLRFNRPS
jgi:PAS domain S-box-containing protein